MILKVCALTLGLLVEAGPVWAQQIGGQQAGHSMPGMADAGPDSMMGSMDAMSKAMAAVPITGDTDRDFTAMMIPHHQGAIDMARYELAHGKDPELRKLSRQIIAAQLKEIAEMKRWLARHP